MNDQLTVHYEYVSTEYTISAFIGPQTGSPALIRARTVRATSPTKAANMSEDKELHFLKSIYKLLEEECVIVDTNSQSVTNYVDPEELKVRIKKSNKNIRNNPKKFKF